jgi:hypothetical protein
MATAIELHQKYLEMVSKNNEQYWFFELSTIRVQIDAVLQFAKEGLEEVKQEIEDCDEAEKAMLTSSMQEYERDIERIQILRDKYLIHENGYIVTHQVDGPPEWYSGDVVFFSQDVYEAADARVFFNAHALITNNQ